MSQNLRELSASDVAADMKAAMEAERVRVAPSVGKAKAIFMQAVSEGAVDAVVGYMEEQGIVFARRE